MLKASNIFIGLKKTCLGVLDRGDRDKNNETGLKEEGIIEMSIYSDFHICDAHSLSLCEYLLFVFIDFFLFEFVMVLDAAAYAGITTGIMGCVSAV